MNRSTLVLPLAAVLGFGGVASVAALAAQDSAQPGRSVSAAKRARLSLRIALRGTRVTVEDFPPEVTGSLRNPGRAPVRLLHPMGPEHPAGRLVAEVRDALTGEPVLPGGECGGIGIADAPSEDAFFSVPPGKAAALDLGDAWRGYREPLRMGRFVVGRRYRLTLRYVVQPSMHPGGSSAPGPDIYGAEVLARVRSLTPCAVTSNTVEFTIAPNPSDGP